MKILKVDSFLCCIKLETGGLVLGCLNAICCAILFLFGISSIMMLHVTKCKEVAEEMARNVKEKIWNIDDFDSANATFTETITDWYDLHFYCTNGRKYMLYFAWFILVSSIGFSVITFLYIKGMLRRNHFNVKPMMCTMGIFTIMSFIQIFSMDLILGGIGAVICIVDTYQFIDMYSVYCKFQSESNIRHTIHYQVPNEKN